MPRNRFLPLAVGPHVVLASVTQEPPSQPAQRLVQIATLHFGLVHLSVYIRKGESARTNIVAETQETTKNEASLAEYGVKVVFDLFAVEVIIADVASRN